MKKLLLIGGGGHCRAAIDVIETNSNYKIIGIVDNKINPVNHVLNYPILGMDSDLPVLVEKVNHVMITVGHIQTPIIRVKLYEYLSKLNSYFPTIVSSNAYISPHARLSDAVLVMHGAIVNSSAEIGCNSILNTMSLIEHDVVIGNHCHISTGARINGGARIGDQSFIGSGAIIHEGVRIGSNCVIGAGCIVKKNVIQGSILRSTDE